jgi:hypothetical protein
VVRTASDWAPVAEAAGVLHVICEGGPRADGPSRGLARVRAANVLDLVERFSAMAPSGQVAVYTSYPELAHGAAALGAAVVRTPAGGFHFGRTLQDAVRRFRPAALLALGGGACPLFSPDDFAFTYRTLRADERVVVANAPGSADMVACNHPLGLLWSELPPIDNSLPRALRALGYHRFLIPNAGRLHFDLDTPTDAVLLRALGPEGPRLAAALAELPWRLPALEAAMGRLAAAPRPHVGLVGRVPSDLLTHLDMTARWRTHVLSEERGMKAQGVAGREAGGLVAALGPERLLEAAAGVCDVLFFDTRPLAQAWGAEAADRFYSDLGMVDRVGHPRLRALTRAAAGSPIPVVLGGHCLVSGGVWLLSLRGRAGSSPVLT